jgi:heme/copper-type cytochrome/quinol oxidase subunit 2
MPIAVKVVSQADYKAWVANAQKQYGAAAEPAATTSVAQAR